ncbi:polysaccharide biosynthesis/export family protein [Sphingomonas sp. M6A6_1c]
MMANHLKGIAIMLCVTLQTPSLAQEKSGIAARGTTLVDYHLGPGDRLRITVYDEEGMTGEYSVSERGTISFPLIGDVEAGGSTVPELRAGIAQRLAKGLVNAPKVTAEVIGFRPFYILGEVNKPGMYPYSPGLTVFSAVATAQGFTYRANARKVLITHAGETIEAKVEVTAATLIEPGDTIRVREKFF